MVSTITARLVSLSNQRAAFSRPTDAMNMKHHRKPHASSATKRPAKHRQGNPFSSVECRRRERAELNYRAATTDQALAKAGRSSCSSTAPTSALPIGIDLSLVQVVPARDHDALHSPSPSNDAEPTPNVTPADDDENASFQISDEPKNDCHGSSDTQRPPPAAPSNVSSSDFSQRFSQRTSSDSDCYDMDFYSGLLSSTRRHYDLDRTETSPTPNNSQPEPANSDDDPRVDRRRSPGFKPTYCEVVARMRSRSTSGFHSDQTAESTWTASLPTTNHKTSENLDSDNASDTSSSGVSSNDSVNSDGMSSTEKPPFKDYLAVVG